MAEGGDMDGNSTNNAVAIHLAGNEPASRRRLRSLVWNDFTKERKADGNCVAICNHCKKQLSASSRSGTTHLKNHLATCTNTKVRKRKKLVVRRLVLKGDKNDGVNMDLSQFDQELSRQDLARMIVLHGYPFTIVHHVGFKAFVKNLQPQFKLMSHDVVKEDCMKIYEGGRVKLRELLEKLPCRVSLTVDMWRSNEDVEYVCLTCHYVDDDWKLKRKYLDFLHVETPTPGEEISKIIAEKLLFWNLHRKLFSVILDNCNEIDVVARELRPLVLLNASVPFNGEFLHLRSAASVLNLIAHDVPGLVCDIVSKVRDSLLYVRSSPTALNNFQIAARKVGAPQKSLVSDVQNSSWVAIYMMLDNACEYQAAFTCLAECDSEYMNPLSSEEWDLAKAVTECLYVLYNAIEKFSEAKIPTSNLYFNDICAFHVLLKNWKASTLPVFATMASQILEKFEDYWRPTLLVMAIASILDPRYKMKSIEYFFKTIYDDADAKIEEIRKYLKELYDQYVKQSNSTSQNQAFLCYNENNSSGSSTTEMKPGVEPKTSSRTLFDARRGLDQYLQETSSSQPQKTDLDLYLDEAVYQSKGSEDNFNILAWWKFHAAKYPVLSIMARDILGIPLSIVAIDGESRVLNQYLSSLDPVTVQALICGQDWLRDEFEGIPLFLDLLVSLFLFSP